MPGLGTIVNMAAIAGGGLIGRFFGGILSDHMQKSLLTACGVVTSVMALGTMMSKMLVSDGSGGFETQGVMMMIASILIGMLIGELLHIESGIEHFGEWLKNKTGNEKDAAFVNAFVTASLTVCIGAMAVIGSIEDGIRGDHSILFTKAVIDCVIILAMAASMGTGAIFAAVPVGIFQGVITVLAQFLAPVLNDQAMDNLSLVGAVMILCVGINILWPRKIVVANMLPALAVAVIWAYLPFAAG
ncbi:MAG: DUF554 domain-containing protein [Eubacteriales bacterium]|nr:DUF554 domain-containing protein [Eubacteriales bacterium]